MTKLTKKPTKKKTNKSTWKAKNVYYATATIQYFKCVHCKGMNLLSSPEGVKAIRLWRKAIDLFKRKKK